MTRWGTERVTIEPDHIRAFLSGRERIEIHDPELTAAGVLLPLFLKNKELHVLLTKRTSDVEHHKNQISFPGGSIDESDRGVIETALRETEEEIGLSRKYVELLGVFDEVWTPSGFRITPVVGFLKALPELHLNHAEVEQTLEIPVSFFLDEANVRVDKFDRRGKPVDVYFYTFGKDVIWGATAAMLRSFLFALQAYVFENKAGGSTNGTNV